MFTGKLFLGLRGGKDSSNFSNKGMRIMTKKVLTHCKEDTAIAFLDDELGRLAKPAVSQILQYGTSANNVKITPVAEKEILLFCEDKNLEMFADMHQVQNIWIQTESRELNAIANERITNFELQPMKSSLIPIRNNQILYIDFGERTIEKLF